MKTSISGLEFTMPTPNLQNLFSAKSLHVFLQPFVSSSQEGNNEESARVERLKECVATLRQDLVALQEKMITYHQNIQTIRRCIQQSFLPPDLPDFALTEMEYHLAGGSYDINVFGVNEEEAELRWALEELSKVTAPKRLCPPTTPLVRKMVNPAVLHSQMQDSEEDKEIKIPVPTSISTDDLETLIVNTGCWEQTKLQLLVLKRAEWEIERDILEGEVGFWAQVWEDCNASIKRANNTPEEMKDEIVEGVWKQYVWDEGKRGGRRWDDDFFIFSKGPSGSSSDSEGRSRSPQSMSTGKSSIKRKEVPVAQILDRIKNESQRSSRGMVSENNEAGEIPRHDSGVEMHIDTVLGADELEG